MALDKSLQDAMNEQLKNELYSAYVYLSMSAYYDSINLPGFAHWMRVQAQEEVNHAMKFYEFITDRGGRVVLKAIDQPPVEFQSPLDAFQRALEHEQRVTAMIHDLYALAVQQGDYASQVFLHWFVEEQVEEEKSASQIVETLKMVGEHGPALVMLDKALGEREAEEE
jgi:ferritin